MSEPGNLPYVPFAGEQLEEPAVRVEDESTTAQWWIALSPIWISFPIIVFLLLGMAVGSAGAIAAGIPVLAWIVLMFLAGRDRRELAGKGFPTVTPLWMLLGPLAYLIVRYRLTRNLVGSSWMPLAVLTTLCTLVALAALVFFGALMGMEAAVGG